jgi:hypothetical protein
MKKLNLTIPKPCHENWNEFTPAEKGRFCGSCQKVVVDFTSWSDEQIKNYFLNSTGSTCGRFRNTQLTSYPIVKINSSTWTASLFALLLMLLSKPALAQVSPKVLPAQEQHDFKTILAQSDTVVSKMTVRGVVRDEENNAMPGANILVKGTTIGAITDAEGKFMFTIENPKVSDTLMVSFIGFTSKEYVLTAAASKELDIIMLYSDVELQGEITVGTVYSRGPRFSLRGLWWRVKNVFR